MAERWTSIPEDWEPLEERIQPKWTWAANIIRVFRQKGWQTATVDEISDTLPEKNKAHKETITNALSRISRGRETFIEGVDRALFKFHGQASYQILADVDEFDAVESLRYEDYVQPTFEVIKEALLKAGKLPKRNSRVHLAFIAVLRKNPALLQLIAEAKQRKEDLASLNLGDFNVGKL